jgi:hypothetical protein
MATFKKRKLSGSTNGKNIKVTGTSTAASVTIHQAVAGTTDGTYDEVWIWAVNTDVVDRILTIEFGGTTAPDDTIVVTVPYKAGLFPIIPGITLQNALYVKAFADAANVVTIGGFVNSMTD